jgi:NAD(P)-dependent dehydrogenase (short-subunit alcohol dehydrogenase family)
VTGRTPFSLQGKVTIVTGGAGGIGAAVTSTLADAGARTVITYWPDATPPEPVDEIGDWIEATGAERPFAVELDLRSLDSIERSVHAVLDRYGRVDVLVNCAGTNIQQFAMDVTERAWDAVLDTNLKGLFFYSQAVARAMKDAPPPEDDWYSIVNVASQMGLVGYYLRAAYCASKAGVVNLTRALAVEWAQYRIRVNAVAPTFIGTPLTEPMLADPEFRADVLSRSPMGMIGTPDDVAAGVLYLCAPASRLVTGHTLVIDGGWTSW